MSSANAIALLASALKLPSESIVAAVQALDNGAYEYWQVAKGNGRMRELSSPVEPLKQVQRAILERLLNNTSVSPFAHGFVPGRSIVTNARAHAATAQAVLNIDLKNAFPSVSKKRVREIIEWRVGPLLKPMNLVLAQEESQEESNKQKRSGRAEDGRFLARASAPPVAGVNADADIGRKTLCDTYDLLTALCTDRDQLPQGAPTSGMLLNLVCARLDRLIYRVLVQSGRSQMRYTRYADDLTISDSEIIADDVIAAVHKAVLGGGFTVSPGKLKHISAKQQDLLICGIRLHRGELTLPRAKIKAYRALFHQALSYDADNIPMQVRQRIVGTLGLLRMVYPCCPAPLMRPLQQLIEQHQTWLKPAQIAAAPFPVYSL